MDKKTIIITALSVVGIIIFLIGAYAMTNKPTQTSFPELKKLRANDHTEWSPAKKNLLVEYSDLQCPACQAYHALLTQISKEDMIKKNITLVYRHYPLDSLHPNARNGAYAAEAASKQGKFWEMHDLLFEKQKEWSESNKPLDFFKKYATSLKLDVAKFEKDFASDAVKQRVQDDLLEGDKFGVQGTPTFFYNGKNLGTPQSPEAFRTMLIEGIEK